MLAEHSAVRHEPDACHGTILETPTIEFEEYAHTAVQAVGERGWRESEFAYSGIRHSYTSIRLSNQILV